MAPDGRRVRFITGQGPGWGPRVLRRGGGRRCEGRWGGERREGGIDFASRRKTMSRPMVVKQLRGGQDGGGEDGARGGAGRENDGGT